MYERDSSYNLNKIRKKAVRRAYEPHMIPIGRAVLKTWRTYSDLGSGKTPDSTLPNMALKVALAFCFPNMAAQISRNRTVGGIDDFIIYCST